MTELSAWDRTLLGLVEVNCVADLEQNGQDTDTVAIVDFRKRIIHANVYPLGWWKRRGYRMFPAQRAVRVEYLDSHWLLFQKVTDLRPQR